MSSLRQQECSAMPEAAGLVAFIVFVGLIAISYGYFAAWMTRRR